MKIVGGEYKGRRIISPKGTEVRPTLERVREAIFNVMAHGLKEWSGSVKGSLVLDLFCGTGSMGIEALSRGASHVTFLEKSRQHLEMARQNASLGAEARKRTTFLKLDATMLPSPPETPRAQRHIAFLDPPYGQDLAIQALSCLNQKRWLINGALAVVETGVEEDFL